MKKRYEVELHQENGVITLYVNDVIEGITLYSTEITGQAMSVNNSSLLFSQLEEVDLYIRTKFGDIHYLTNNQ